LIKCSSLAKCASDSELSAHNFQLRKQAERIEWSHKNSYAYYQYKSKNGEKSEENKLQMKNETETQL
jgi:hypothetical protein